MFCMLLLVNANLLNLDREARVGRLKQNNVLLAHVSLV